jgi:dynein heavy chain
LVHQNYICIIFIPFSGSCNHPYQEIDRANNDLMEIDELHDKLLTQALLFEIPQPEPNILDPTKKSLFLNKVLWDFVLTVKSWMSLWLSTLWKNVDFELMDLELKRFSKELRGTYLIILNVF